MSIYLKLNGRQLTQKTTYQYPHWKCIAYNDHWWLFIALSLVSIIRSVPCSAHMLGHQLWEALINNPYTLQRCNFLYTCISMLPLISNHFYSHIIHTNVAVYWNVKESMYACLIIWSWVLSIFGYAVNTLINASTCVADIRGGNRRNNSSVQLNHLFT